MVQGGRRARLRQKPPAGDLVGPQSLGEKLQGDLAAQGGVFGQIHLPHPAFAQFLEDLIVAQPPTDHRYLANLS
jgi:hypothetical protein